MMSINRISLYHLETLIWIARLGSFGAAAEQMNTTQPAISARIKELEDRLGAVLFHKHGRAMTLSPAGRDLVQEYIPIWERLQETLLKSGGLNQIRGIVRIGAGEIAASACLPRFVTDMHSQWSDLKFEIEIELTAQLIAGLINGRIDIAFAAGFVAHPVLAAVPIGNVELGWVASPQVAERFNIGGVKSRVPLWSLPSHSPIHEVMRQELLALPFDPKTVNLCNNVRTIIDVVASGDGIALVPLSMADGQLGSGGLVRIMPEKKIRPITFHVVSRSAEGDPVIKEILKYASQIKLGANRSQSNIAITVEAGKAKSTKQ